MIVAPILAALAVAPDSTPPPENTIEVLAQKLREAALDLRFRRENGVLRIKKCELVQSSGDSDADAIGCVAARDCVARDFRKKRDVRACTKERALELLDELVERRTQAENAL
ncbi:MAG: hypothetical protein AAF707_08290 [Pseudomonadota bacterium]